MIKNSGAEPETGCAGAVGAQAPAATPLFLELPAPPSANALFRDNPRGGRIKSKLYKDWIGHAGWRLREQRPHAIGGPVVILIGVERTNNRADIDNRIKPTLDLLVEHKIIVDDSAVIGVAAAWSPSRDGLMRVAVIPAAELAVRFQLADSRHGGWFLEASQSEEEG